MQQFQITILTPPFDGFQVPLFLVSDYVVFFGYKMLDINLEQKKYTFAAILKKAISTT